MKSVKFLFTCTSVIVLLLIGLFVVNQGIVNAAEKEDDKCFIVSLRGDASGKTEQVISINPQYVTVPKGSCVVWINWVRGPEISTSFKEGKICDDNTASPVGYRLTPGTGCYVTDYLTEGGTSSLRFMETGDYKYDIFVKGKTAPLVSGKITVK